MSAQARLHRTHSLKESTGRFPSPARVAPPPSPAKARKPEYSATHTARHTRRTIRPTLRSFATRGHGQRQNRHRDQQQEQKASLRDPMKIGRLEFINVIHEEAVRKIGIHMRVQLPPIGIHQTRKRGKPARPQAAAARASLPRSSARPLLDSPSSRPKPVPALPSQKIANSTNPTRNRHAH